MMMIEKVHRPACVRRLGGCSGRSGSSCSIALPQGADLGGMKATPVKAKLGHAFIWPSLRQMLRPRLICVKHLGHRLRLSLAHHATIATAAARGSPPAGMSSGEPSATKPRERLALEFEVHVLPFHTSFFDTGDSGQGATDAVDSALSA